LWYQSRIFWGALATYLGIVILFGFISGRQFGLSDVMSLSGVLGSYVIVRVASRQQKELDEARHHSIKPK